MKTWTLLFSTNSIHTNSIPFLQLNISDEWGNETETYVLYSIWVDISACIECDSNLYPDFISLDITVLIWLNDKNVNQNNDCITKAFSIVHLNNIYQ